MSDDYRPILREDTPPTEHDEPAPLEAANYAPIRRGAPVKTTRKQAAKKTTAKTAPPEAVEETPAQPATDEESA